VRNSESEKGRGMSEWQLHKNRIQKTSLTQSPNSEHLKLKISNKKEQQILSVRWNSTSYLN